MSPEEEQDLCNRLYNSIVDMIPTEPTAEEGLRKRIEKEVCRR